MQARTIKDSFGDRIFLGIIYALLFIVLISILYPLVYIVSASFSSGDAIRSGRVWLLPVEPTLRGYEAIFNNPDVISGFMNTFIYTVLGTSIAVVLTIALAYPLSKNSFVGRKLIMVLLVVTMLFDGGLIPYYLTVKSYNMLDTIWAMVIPGAIGIWQVIIARTFFQMTIPDELSEASELDGCSDIRYLWSIVIPLSKPIIAVLVLMYAVSHWNAYFDALIFLKSKDKFPLQLILREILILNSVDSMTTNMEELQAKQDLSQLLKYSLIVISTGPILLFYPFIQKYFVKGMLIGSVKG